MDEANFRLNIETAAQQTIDALHDNSRKVIRKYKLVNQEENYDRGREQKKMALKQRDSVLIDDFVLKDRRLRNVAAVEVNSRRRGVSANPRLHQKAKRKRSDSLGEEDKNVTLLNRAEA